MSPGIAQPPRPDDQPLISVIIPVHNGAGTLERCLEALFASDCTRFECIVVDDSSTDQTAAVASRFPVRLITLGGGPYGPAYGRNRAAEESLSPILFFLDADVLLYPDVLSRTIETLADQPDVSAVFGSYDDSPDSPDFVSQFKNLEHHFVHQHGLTEGTTFWSGCGAIRREPFLAVGGFDSQTYPRPSVEDIDLGYRLRDAGFRILLLKDLNCKHLKRWTLRTLARSDLLERAVPWTLLILRDRRLPNDLNLRSSQRLSLLFFSSGLLILVGAWLAQTEVALLPLIAVLALVSVGSITEGWVPGIALSWRMELTAWIVLGAVAVIGTRQAGLVILAPLSLVLVAMFAARHLPHSSRSIADAELKVAVLGLIATAGLVVASFPLWLTIPLVGSLTLTAVLNYRFLAFLTRQKGVIYALAAIPYQLLYYCCGAVGLAMGLALHVSQVRRDRSETLVSLASSLSHRTPTDTATPLHRQI